MPVVAAIAHSNGMPAGHVAAWMAIAAAIATIFVWRDGGSSTTRIVVAAALTMAPILMVYAGTGLWQVDWHMYFFVVFGMLVVYVDWRPIAVAAALTAAHHVVLSVLFPHALFPESDLPRVVLHASIVLVDAVVLFWLVRQTRRLFARIEHANVTLEAGIAQRTSEVSALNATLGSKIHELENAFLELETEAAERKETAIRMDHLAHHDLVTGLPNRVLLMDRLKHVVAAAERAGSEALVIFIDLDRFKEFNDMIGHSAGDQALRKTAGRISRCIRSGDTASRVGGDEFVVVCASADGVRETPEIVRRIMTVISEPMKAGSTVVNLAASIGVSLYPADGSDCEELIKKADAAMYRAKQNGRNRFQLYTSEIHAEILAEARLRYDLEQAIKFNQFVVYYQPVVSLKSKAVIGAEALVRWQHPERGLLPPSQFIDFAEKHGLIVPIGEAVFETACANTKRFAGLTDGEFTMAINVSAIQFRQAGFVDKIVRTLDSHAIDRSQLEIEITESVFMDEGGTVLTTLHALKALGIRLSIDDFGTGYSSLSYIKNFPVHTLKIDRSFVQDIASNTTDRAIAATIVALAHNLGMRVIAEGIEDEDQLEQLRLLGADDIQGYLISRPLCATDFEIFTRAYGVMTTAA